MRRNTDNAATANDGFIANLSRPTLGKGLTTAGEVAVDVSSERKAHTRVSFASSLQYLIIQNLKIDRGVYLGLNKATPCCGRYAVYPTPSEGVSFQLPLGLREELWNWRMRQVSPSLRSTLVATACRSTGSPRFGSSRKR